MKWKIFRTMAYSGGVCFIDERLKVFNAALCVRVLEQNGRSSFVDLGDLVQVDDVHFEAHNFCSRLYAGDCLRVKSVRHQE